MKSRKNLVFVALATTLLLTACGTDTGNPEPVTEEPVVEVEETDAVSGVENDKPASEEVAGTNEDIKGNDDKEPLADAKQTESDEQEYVLSVLPGYLLTSEEPGKDSLLVEGDESTFMRIETAPKDEDAYSYLVDNMNEILVASSDGKSPIELTDIASLPAGDGIDKTKALSTQTESGQVTGVVFEKDELIIRLTIFDNKDGQHLDNFLQMAETIVKK